MANPKHKLPLGLHIEANDRKRDNILKNNLCERSKRSIAQSTMAAMISSASRR